jgi:hypothetical protein
MITDGNITGAQTNSGTDEDGKSCRVRGWKNVHLKK